MSDPKDDYTSKTLERLEKSVEKVDEKCDHIDKNMSVFGAQFQDHLKQDELMYEEFKTMVAILRENTDSLKEHVMRTNTLQDMVITMNAQLTPIVQDRIKKEAVREFVNMRLKRWGKILGAIGTVVGIIYTIVKLTHGI